MRPSAFTNLQTVTIFNANKPFFLAKLDKKVKGFLDY